MFPAVQVVATTVDSERASGVRLCAAPAKLASLDVQQILSPRLTNIEHGHRESRPGYSSFDGGHEIARLKREILVVHEDARGEKKAANKASSVEGKEFYDAQAQVSYLGRESTGREAELAYSTVG